MRELLDGGGLAQPDEVTYEPSSVILRWRGPKLAVIVDLDPVPGLVHPWAGATNLTRRTRDVSS